MSIDLYPCLKCQGFARTKRTRDEFDADEFHEVYGCSACGEWQETPTDWNSANYPASACYECGGVVGTCRCLRDEVRSVLVQLDEFAAAWGDEAMFRRCRDRLREAVRKAEGEGKR